MSAPHSQPMRVALVQSAALPGQRMLAVARALRAAGHQPTLVEPQVTTQPQRSEHVDAWLAEGFAWLPVTAARLVPAEEHFPRHPSLAVARALTGVLTAFDAAWFFEQHWAMPLLRERRFRDRCLPLVVLDVDIAAPIPESLEAINQRSAAAYATRWADASLTGSPAADVKALETLWTARRNEAPAALAAPQTSPAVTVCIPYYEAPEWLPLTLASLERQTTTSFTVIVVDDGSITDTAQRAFAACAARYAARGWRFLTQPNASPGAARNHAAREAATEFLLFLDSTTSPCQQWSSVSSAPRCSPATTASSPPTTASRRIRTSPAILKAPSPFSTIRPATTSSAAWPTTCTAAPASSFAAKPSCRWRLLGRARRRL